MHRLLIFCLLSFSICYSKSSELIKGTFIEVKSNFIFSFKSPQLDSNKVWLNRVQSISPKMPVWISDDGRKIVINKVSNSPNKSIQLTLQSYKIDKTDKFLALNEIQLIDSSELRN